MRLCQCNLREDSTLGRGQRQGLSCIEYIESMPGSVSGMTSQLFNFLFVGHDIVPFQTLCVGGQRHRSVPNTLRWRAGFHSHGKLSKSLPLSLAHTLTSMSWSRGRPRCDTADAASPVRGITSSVFDATKTERKQTDHVARGKQPAFCRRGVPPGSGTDP